MQPTLAVVLLRISGLLTLVRLLGVLPTVFVSWSADARAQEQMFRAATLAQRASAVIVFITAVALIFGARRIARSLDIESDPLTLAVDARQLSLIAMTLLAIYFVVLGIHSAAKVGIALAMKKWDERPALEYLHATSGDALPSGLAYSTAGAVLLLARKRLAQLAE
ncbi:MAG TPA: hypothetical protein VF911_13605 [Thermoanaerobaculia bacterium]